MNQPRRRLEVLFSTLVITAAATAQESRFAFDTPQIQLDAYGTSPFQRLIDIDGDGDWDAVGGSVSKSSTLAVGWRFQAWSNDGSGRFVPYWMDSGNTVPSGTNAQGMPIAVGDMNGDGNGDFAAAAGVQLWRFLSDPTSTSFTRSADTIGAMVHAIAVADFDGDGKDDVAALTSTHVIIRPESGPPFVAAHGVTAGANDRLIVLDTDGDPRPDVALVTATAVIPFVIEAGTISTLPSLSLAHAGSNVDGSDVDGDGDDDLVAFYMGSGPGSSRVEIFRRTGTTQWNAEPEYAGGPAEYLADVDGDGDSDGVCCGGSGSNGNHPTLDFISTFEIAINEGGVFEPAIQIPGLGSRSLAGAQDVDGDGDIDLVAGRCVYFQRPGGWTGGRAIGLATIDSEIELADFDGDGDVDPWRQTLTNPGIESIAYRNRGDGGYPTVPMLMEALPPGLAAAGPRILGDFDRDGDADVILGVWQGSTFLHQGLWRNSGGASFHYAGPASPPGVSFFVDTVHTRRNFFVGDIQNDGDIDLVMTTDPTSDLTLLKHTVFLNDGNAVLTPAHTESTRAYALADFDVDGYLDLLVVANSGVAIRRGVPASAGGPFVNASFSLNGLSFLKDSRVDVGDFNHDGYPDIAALKYVDQTGPDWRPCVYVNGIPSGAGLAFLERQISADGFAGYDPGMVAVDANHDGLEDFLFGPLDKDRAWRLYTRKPGAIEIDTQAFEPGVDLVLPGVVRDDVDGDGDGDLIGEYLTRNLTISGEDAGARLQYGAGSPGTAGIVATLGASGPFRPGENPILRLSGATATSAFVAVSTGSGEIADFPYSGLSFLLDPFSPAFFYVTAPLATKGGPGEAILTVPFFIAPAWAGAEICVQAFPMDAGAPNGSISSTNALRLTFGG